MYNESLVLIFYRLPSILLLIAKNYCRGTSRQHGTRSKQPCSSSRTQSGSEKRAMTFKSCLGVNFFKIDIQVRVNELFLPLISVGLPLFSFWWWDVAFHVCRDPIELSDS